MTRVGEKTISPEKRSRVFRDEAVSDLFVSKATLMATMQAEVSLSRGFYSINEVVRVASQSPGWFI